MTIFDAISDNNWDAFQICLKETGVLGQKDAGYQASPLWSACCTGRCKMIEALLDRGADTAARDRDGETCLHALMRCSAASRDELVDAIHMLVKAGADPNVADKAGLTAYDYIGKNHNEHRFELTDALSGVHDPLQVVFNRKAGPMNLKEVYLFDLRERVTYAMMPGSNTVAAICRDSFASIGDTPVLREAFAEHQKRGGTLSEADVIPPSPFGTSFFNRK